MREVKLEDSLLFLDRRLLALGWQELRPLFLHIHRIAECTTALRDLVAECKVNGVSLSAPLQLKVNKIHDAVLEHLPVISIALPVCSEQQICAHSIPDHLLLHSSLPDREYLLSFSQRLKTRCKAIEEMLSSKKLDACRFKFSGKLSLCGRVLQAKVFDISLLRKEIHSLQELLETLLSAVSAERGRFVLILQFFEKVKHELHWQLQQLVLHAAQLPDLRESEGRLRGEMEHFQSSEECYRRARSERVLADVAALRCEEKEILEEMRSLMRERLPCKEMLQSLHLIAQREDELMSEEEREIVAELLCGESEEDQLNTVLCRRWACHPYCTDIQ